MAVRNTMEIAEALQARLSALVGVKTGAVLLYSRLEASQCFLLSVPSVPFFGLKIVLS